ncbi:hypothetical protein [Hanstruepera flava]|uniref:hypothetical protein n=1 Tax=Hanstruepera flava TaxID=2930218 RepID=UPI00202832AF|nr:hypothetical protein [Hanstruepera flava]
MIKKLVIVFILAFALKSVAQSGTTASPYSFYGIGSLKFKGTVENRSMGGLSIYSDSIHINLRNPAAYGGENLAVYRNENRPVTFSLAASHTQVKLKSDSGKDNLKNSSLDYFALAIPIGKLGVGVGLIPYTSVGFKLETLNDDGTLNERFDGDGGLNRTYLSLGYPITKNLSAGIDFSFYFGNIKNSTIKYLYNTDGDLVQYQTKESNRSDMSGLSVNIGLLYKAKISDKLDLHSGLTFQPETTLNSNNERAFSTIVTNSSTGQEFVINTIDAGLEARGLDKTKANIPYKLSLGAGIGQERIWFVGMEYTYFNMKNFSNELYVDNGTDYENSTSLSIGGFIIPKYNAFDSYFKRTVYRAGVRFGSTGLNINNTSIDEFGISFGVGLPVGTDFFSNANIGFEFGSRGTVENNLVKENYFKFQLGLSLNDWWFKKNRLN